MLWFIHGHGYQDYGISSAFKRQLNKSPKYSTRSNHVLRVKYLLTQSLHLQPSTPRTPKTLSIKVNKGLYNRCKMSSSKKRLSQGILPHISQFDTDFGTWSCNNIKTALNKISARRCKYHWISFFFSLNLR